MTEELKWIDASEETPPEESLFLVIGDRDGQSRTGDLAAGFYAEGEYLIGTSMAGDPLPDDQVVLFWARAVWPRGYDENGIWQGKDVAMPRFTLDGHTFAAENCVDGVLINPSLPEGFDHTANEARPASHAKWWNRPFIVTETVEQLDAFYAERTDEYADEGRQEWQDKGRASWMNTWSSGTRYETRCLDGGAWDRATSWGMFATLEEALACAGSGPHWRRN